jgi:hypothetical protein
VTGRIAVDGSLAADAWAELPWAEDFVDITGDSERKPRFRTRVKMGWDDEFFYVGAELEEPHVWGTITEKNAKMFEDNDFEVFIDPDGDGRNYYEFEINALGTIWELSLPKPYGEGGVPVLGCNLPGLKCAVRVRGTLNDPSDTDDAIRAARLRRDRATSGRSTSRACSGGTRWWTASTSAFRRTARRFPRA